MVVEGEERAPRVLELGALGRVSGGPGSGSACPDGSGAGFRRGWCGGGEQRLFFCFHADTDQESTDHGARLAWVGPRDPLPLDHGFFEDPPAS